DSNTVKGAVADLKVKGVGGDSATASPWQLLSTTFGDQLRLSNNFQSKSIGVSLKDRAATIIAGRHGSAAYWFDTRGGAMVTSTYFMEYLPQWVADFN